MSKFFILLLCTLMTFPAFSKGLEDWQKAMVKVSSYPCQTGRPRFDGTGFLVSYQDKTYVLTSEHALLHDSSSSLCHEIQNDKETKSAQLVTVDYLKGMALLKISKPSSKDFSVSYEQLQNKGIFSAVQALGYPALADTLHILSNGRIVNAQSRRALIPGLHHLIEFINLPVEKGMSGGAFVDTNGAFVGMISHQILKREMGLASEVIKLQTEGNPNDLALGIPATEVASWFLAQMENNPQELKWQRLEKAQRSGKEVLQFGPLLFSLEKKKAQDIWSAAASGIGGRRCGGADGCGIGGLRNEVKEKMTEDEILNSVEVTLNPQASAELRGTTMANPYLEKWKTWLLRGQRLQTIFLREPKATRLTEINSLEQFLTAWLRDGNEPLLIRSADGNDSLDINELRKLALQFAELAQAQSDQLGASDESKAWLKRLRDLSLMVSNGLVTSGEVSGVLNGPNSIYWQNLYEQDFTQATKLESALQKLLIQMKKIGI